MKKFFLQIVSILIVANCFANYTGYDVTNYGAIGDGKVFCTNHIQKAIDDCHQKGGGTVYVPAGVFKTGTIFLKSNVNLFLDMGAVLKGSENLADYSSYTMPEYGKNYYGIVYAADAEHVSISGQGIIDGNNLVFFNWEKAKKIEWGGTQYSRQKDNFRKVESGIGDGPVEPKDRPRQMIIFARCKYVDVKDVQLLNAPFWTMHFADCDGVKVSNISIATNMLVPNADGIDFTSCSNVIVSGCDIRSGDDALVITGYAHHYELPGFNNERHASTNFIISNCNLQSASSAIRIGWMDQNNISNIQISNINITNSTRGINISVRDEGSVSNVNISNVNIETKFRTGDWWGNGEPIQVSAVRGKEKIKMGAIRNVRFKNVTCLSENGILVYASNEGTIDDVIFDDVKLTIKSGQYSASSGGNIDLRGTLNAKDALFESELPGWYFNGVSKLRLNDCSLQWQQVDFPWFTHALKVDNFSDVRISNFSGTANPHHKALQPIARGKGNGWLIN